MRRAGPLLILASPFPLYAVRAVVQYCRFFPPFICRRTSIVSRLAARTCFLGGSLRSLRSFTSNVTLLLLFGAPSLGTDVLGRNHALPLRHLPLVFGVEVRQDEHCIPWFIVSFLFSLLDHCGTCGHLRLSFPPGTSLTARRRPLSVKTSKRAGSLDSGLASFRFCPVPVFLLSKARCPVSSEHRRLLVYLPYSELPRFPIFLPDQIEHPCRLRGLGQADG